MIPVAELQRKDTAIGSRLPLIRWLTELPFIWTTTVYTPGLKKITPPDNARWEIDPALKLAGESLPSAWKNLNYHSMPEPHFPPLIFPPPPSADVCRKDEIVNGGASRNKLIQPKVKYHNSEMTTGDCSPDQHEN